MPSMKYLGHVMQHLYALLMLNRQRLRPLDEIIKGEASLQSLVIISRLDVARQKHVIK